MSREFYREKALSILQGLLSGGDHNSPHLVASWLNVHADVKWESIGIEPWNDKVAYGVRLVDKDKLVEHLVRTFGREETLSLLLELETAQ